MPITDATNAKNLVKVWMEQMGISNSVEVIPSPKGTSFQFNGLDVTGTPFAVLQPETWKKTLLVVSEIRISEEHTKSIELMRPKDRDEFLQALQKDIWFAPTLFSFDPTFDKTGIPKSVQFTIEICYDGLSEDRLNEAMRDVVKSILFVKWRFQKEFGNIPTKE